MTQKRQINLTLQGKGGVGKSFISALLAQFYAERGEPLVCIDTDPVNATLGGYKSLNARRLELMDGGTLIERRFDDMMEMILSEDANFVIDNGAASFLPLSNYLVENGAIQMMGQAGREVVIHTVITGGQALQDTLRGFNALAEQLPSEARLIVWLNEYFGPIEHTDNDSGERKTFEQMKVYDRHKGRISGLIRIPKQTASTFGRDVELMLDRRQTFGDVAKSAEFNIMAKQRLSTVRQTLFDQMKAAV